MYSSIHNVVTVSLGTSHVQAKLPEQKTLLLDQSEKTTKDTDVLRGTDRGECVKTK
jgi:hypothetical protein